MLETLQDTHDEQVQDMKRIKRMRSEMMVLFADDAGSHRNLTPCSGLQSGYNSSSQGSMLDHTSSTGNAAHFADSCSGSCPGSGASSHNDRYTTSSFLDADVPPRPHTPPAHASSNTITYALQSGLHLPVGAHHHSSHSNGLDSPSTRSGSMSMSNATSITSAGAQLHVIAGDYVADMRMLMDEEKDARLKLAKLSSLIDNAISIDKQLALAIPKVA